MNKGMRSAALASIAGVGLASNVQAGNVTIDLADHANPTLFSQSQVVWANQPNVDAFNISGAGQLTLSLDAYVIPNTLSNLQFGVTDLASTSVNLGGPRTLTLSLTGPQTVYLDVFGSGSGAAGIGIYNVTAKFISATSAVPLPASGLLLLSGLVSGVGLAFARRERTKIM